MVQNLSLETVRGIVFCDVEGNPLFSKYYSTTHPSLLNTSAFEKKLIEKTIKTPTGEIVMLDGVVCVYKNILDVFVYLIASSDINEIMLFASLTTLTDALTIVYRSQVEKRLLLESPDLAFLTIDETFERGILMESDASLIAARVTRFKPEDEMLGFKLGMNEQTLTQAFSMARDQITKSLMK